MQATTGSIYRAEGRNPNKTNKLRLINILPLEQKQTNMKSSLLQLFCLTTIIISSLPLLQASESEVGNETPFTYKQGTDKGPERWGQVDPHWKICSSGKLQSPIDLLHQRVQILPTLGKLRRDYQPAPAVLKNRGHDIMVEWTGDAGKLHINGTDYRLVQCHWHSPSEHTFNGSRYHLEVHLVHKNAEEKTAVVGVVYKYGHPDSFLSKLLPHLKTAGIEGKELGIVNPGDIKFGSRKYYRYIGSLTVPPCTEGVIWTISKKVRTVSMEQVRALRDAVHDGFGANARPVQALNGRTVTLYIPEDA